MSCRQQSELGIRTRHPCLHCVRPALLAYAPSLLTPQHYTPRAAEFLQCLVRAAVMKYVRPGIMTDVSTAVQHLFTEVLTPRVDPKLIADPNDFRRRCAYTEEVDASLRRHEAALRKLFAATCALETSVNTLANKHVSFIKWKQVSGEIAGLGWVAWLGGLAGLLDASASKLHPPLFLPPLPLPLPLPPPLLQTHKRPTNRDSRLHSLCGSSRLVAPTLLSGQRRSVCAYAGLDPSQASLGLALYCLLALLILPLALNFASGIACRAPCCLSPPCPLFPHSAMPLAGFWNP